MLCPLHDQELEAELAAEKQKTSVAVRFVQWFTERGENYEHNLKVLDKHIGNLAQGSHPKDRQPFQGQIRFTPVMQQEHQRKLQQQQQQP
jgi:hypothetical protein